MLHDCLKDNYPPETIGHSNTFNMFKGKCDKTNVKRGSYHMSKQLMTIFRYVITVIPF